MKRLILALLLFSVVSFSDTHTWAASPTALSNSTLLTDASLVSYWSMDGNANDYKNLNNATFINATFNFSEGMNGSYQFDGIGTYANISNGTSLQIMNGTISAWIKTSNPGSSYRALVAKSLSYGMFLQSNIFGVYDWNASKWYGSGVSLNDGVWHHVVFAFQSGVAGGSNLYIDGVLKNTTTYTITSNTNPLTLGYNTIATAQYFNGSIDDVAVFNRALSAAEISTLYIQNTSASYYLNWGPLANDPNLVSYWTLDTSTANDTKNKYNGTVVNATFNATGGQFGGAFQFNGTTDYINLGNNLDIAYDAQQTYSAWFKRNSYGGYQTIMSKSNYSSPYAGWLIEFLPSGVLSYEMINWYPTNALIVRTTTTFNNTNWHHMVVVKRDNHAANLTIYMDGVAQPTTITYDTLTTSATTNINAEIGGRNGTLEAFNGTIDDVAIWNRTLTSMEVSKLFANPAINVVPASADTVVFNGNSSKNCMWDLAVNISSFSINAGYSGTVNQTIALNITNGYTQAGTGSLFTQGGNVSVTGTTTLTTGTLTGNVGYNWTTGIFTKTGGTITNNVFNLILTGTGTLSSTGNWLNRLTIQSGTTSITSGAAVLTYTFINQATIDIPSTATLRIMDTYTNNGIITGSGSIEIDVITSPTFTLGTANNASLSFILMSWAASQTVSLNGNLSIGGTFGVSSQHATNTMTLSHGSNYTLSVTGLTTLSTNGVMTQGTGLWNFSGGYLQNGAGSLFTQGGNITVTNWDMTAGTLTGAGSYPTKITVSGYFNISGFTTVTAYKLSLAFNGSNTIYYQSGTFSHLGYDVLSGTNTFGGSAAWMIAYGMNITTGSVMNISSGKTFKLLDRASTAMANLGTINGSGAMQYYIDTSSPASLAVNFGTVNAPAQIQTYAPLVANKTISLGANTVFGSTLTINSSETNYSIVLSGNTYNLTVLGVTNLDGNDVMNQSTGIWNFSGGFSQVGTNTTFKQGGNVFVNSAIMNLSQGAFRGLTGFNVTNAQNIIVTNNSFSNVSLIMTGTGKTISLNSSIPNLIITGNVTQLSNLTLTYLNITGSLNISSSLFLNNPNMTLSNGGKLNVLNGYITNATLNQTTFWMRGSNMYLSGNMVIPPDQQELHNISSYVNVSDLGSGNYDISIWYPVALTPAMYLWDGSFWQNMNATQLANSLTALNQNMFNVFGLFTNSTFVMPPGSGGGSGGTGPQIPVSNITQQNNKTTTITGTGFTNLEFSLVDIIVLILVLYIIIYIAGKHAQKTEKEKVKP